MATCNKNQNSTDVFLRDLLECPVCMETIKSVPVYQCTNGHVMCKICIEKLNNCPICRNDSALVRSLKLENIVQRLEGVQPENMGPTTAKPNLQKWGKGSVRDYGTSNGPNQKPRFEPNLQATPRQATPRQATPRQVTNNQDEEAVLLQREWAENRERWLYLTTVIQSMPRPGRLHPGRQRPGRPRPGRPRPGIPGAGIIKMKKHLYYKESWSAIGLNHLKTFSKILDFCFALSYFL